MVEAELDDPVVLRSFPRASLSRIEVFEGGQRSAAYDQVWQTEGRGIAVGDAVEPDDATTIGTSLDRWSWFRAPLSPAREREREGNGRRRDSQSLPQQRMPFSPWMRGSGQIPDFPEFCGMKKFKTCPPS